MKLLGANPSTRGAIVVAALALLVGCGGGGGASSTPPVSKPTATPATKATATPTTAPTAAPQRLYFTYYNQSSTSGSTPLSYLTSPFAAASTPTTFSLASGAEGLNNVAVDPAGDLTVTEPVIDAVASYTRPNPTAQELFSVPLGFAAASFTYGPNGNLYITDDTNGRIDSAPGPLTATTTFTPLVTTGIAHPYGVVFDAAGNLYETEYTSGIVQEFTPPYTGAPTVVETPTNQEAFASTYDSVTNQLVVELGDGSGGDLLIYNLPLGANPTPTATIAYTDAAPTAIAVDKSGNLYAAIVTQSASSIQVFAPPFVSSTSPAPLLTLPLPLVQGSNVPAFSLAFGT